MTVSFDVRERAAIVTIDRPDARNAVDSATASELVSAFERFDADVDLDVAILYGAGGNFCAGADLKEVAAGSPRLLSEEGPGPMGPTRMRLTKPVIAAVEGYAVAGGLELALWCDLRVAADDAVFGVFCRRFGVPLIDLGTIRLPRLIGQSRALDMILTGRGVDASEALAWGLANRVCRSGQALETALRLAGELSALPQTCMRGDRASVYEGWDLAFEEALRNEFRHGMATIRSGETAAGAARFSGGAGRHGTEATDPGPVA